jgi:hypothetical protein
MKRTLLILIALPFIIGSCTKSIIREEDRLTGRWVLLYAEKENNYSKTTIYTGFEQGLFYFYENGQAEFEDAAGLLRGNWQWRRESNGYYDNEGYYHSGSRQAFRLYMTDFQGYPVIDWDFDDSWMSNNNRFTATFDTYNYTYRYVFVRQ